MIDSLASCLKYMDLSIIFVLSFISLKLAASSVIGFHIGAIESLVIILSILSIGVIMSLISGVSDEKQSNEVVD